MDVWRWGSGNYQGKPLAHLRGAGHLQGCPPRVEQRGKHNVAAAVSGDFSGDGIVDFSDFFAFADHFGTTAADAGWDPAFDFDGSGEVDFSDFFRFADFFGADAGKRARLMELAALHIGLPWSVLAENAPNPFNAETIIGYYVVRPAEVELHIYDIAGQRVRQLREGVRGAGSYRTRWDGRDDDGRSVSSGVYLYRITATGAAPGPAGLPPPRKMLLLR